jgi:hypothetical protein
VCSCRRRQYLGGAVLAGNYVGTTGAAETLGDAELEACMQKV